jgi:ankyrin repeat protein
MPVARRSRNPESDDAAELARAVRRLIQLFMVLGILLVIGVVGVVVWFQRGQSGQKLIQAVEEDQPAAVARLLDSGIDVNTVDEEGVSPLMLASYHGFKPIVEMLLQRGAKVGAKNNRQETALRLAGSAHADIVRLLLEHGADPNVKDFYGKTLLVALCEAGADRDAETIRLLLEHGADPNMRGENGTPLLYAINMGPHGSAEIARLLLDHGANPDARDKSDSPALDCAVDKHNAEIVQALIAKKVSLNTTDALGRTALKVAEENQLTEIATLLRNAGGKE